MHNFKRSVIATTTFLICVFIISLILISAFINSESKFYHDKNYRNELVGTLDCLVLGSSGGLDGFRPTTFNNETGHSSYNLCSGNISPRGKIRLLEEEIYRNPINTVIAIVDDDEIGYDAKKKIGEGEIFYLPRINRVSTRLSTVLTDVLVKDYMTIYSRYLNEGVKYSISKIKKNDASKVKRENLGWYEENSVDVTISEKELEELINNDRKIVIIDKNRECFCDLIEECQSNNIDVILLTLPVSEARIFKYDNYDEWHDIYNSIAEQYGCVYIDMNLLKNRNQIVSATESFSSPNHLSVNGATTSTKEFSRIYNRILAGEDISDMFYPSYDEAIKHLEHYEIYQSLMKEQN